MATTPTSNDITISGIPTVWQNRLTGCSWLWPYCAIHYSAGLSAERHGGLPLNVLRATVLRCDVLKRATCYGATCSNVRRATVRRAQTCRSQPPTRPERDVPNAARRRTVRHAQTCDVRRAACPCHVLTGPGRLPTVRKLRKAMGVVETASKSAALSSRSRVAGVMPCWPSMPRAAGLGLSLPGGGPKSSTPRTPPGAQATRAHSRSSPVVR